MAGRFADLFGGKLGEKIMRRRPYFFCLVNRQTHKYTEKTHERPIYLDDYEAELVANHVSGSVDLIPKEKLE